VPGRTPRTDRAAGLTLHHFIDTIMPAAPSSLLIRNVRPLGDEALDVLIEAGRFTAVGRELPVPAGCAVEDGAGALLLPGLVEGHTHLDKTLWGLPWYRNEVGPLLTDKIDNERDFRAASGHDAGEQSLALAQAFLACGTTRLRTHVDIDTQAGLAHLDGVLRTRSAMRPLQQIQLVAFPQSGLLRRPGTAQLLDRAMAQGADVLGGLDPCAIDGDPVASLDALFDIADRRGCPLDIHLHEPGAMGAFSLDLILQRTQALGLHGRVAISHGFCLGEVAERERDALLARMAALGVVLVTSAPPSRIVPPLHACRAAGVTVVGGNDGIRDTWSPYGLPDMLERAMLIGMRYNLRRDDELAIALNCVTEAAARGLGFDEYGLAPGCRADAVLVDAQTIAQAVVARPRRRCVVAAGRIVARDGVLLSEASST
jgi:cytosine deaminase